ncbi:MAG: hypothetical protein RJA61_163 [Candidatus Parcubacteria bacterium]|jgi:LysM repeat protein
MQTLFSFIFVSSYLALPAQAHAGIFSFMADLLGGTKEVYRSGSVNTQNMALLQASIGPGTVSEGGGEITIVNGTALVPDISPSGEALKDVRPTSDQISLYVVRPGDNLSQIASMFNVSVDTIRWSNDIKGNVITEGQTLVILPVSGVRHTVVKGDTLSTIAKKYGGDAKEIAGFNNIAEGVALKVGDVVIVPDGESHSEHTNSQNIASSNTTVVAGYFIRPITGGRKTQGIHGYNGVDLAAPVGTPIVAAASGEVIVSRSGGWNGGYGNYIVIAHPNGTQTLYSHNSENIVFQGESVIKGQIIGFIGSTGKSTGPHVHFEIRGAKNPF